MLFFSVELKQQGLLKVPYSNPPRYFDDKLNNKNDWTLHLYIIFIEFNLFASRDDESLSEIGCYGNNSIPLGFPNNSIFH